MPLACFSCDIRWVFGGWKEVLMRLHTFTAKLENIKISQNFSSFACDCRWVFSGWLEEVLMILHTLAGKLENISISYDFPCFAAIFDVFSVGG